MTIKIDITTIQSSADMGQVDTTYLSPRLLPQSIYDAIVSSSWRHPDKTAIQYILDGDCLGPKEIPFSKKLTHQLLKTIKGKSFANPYREVSYSHLARSVTQVANALTQLGIERESVTSIVMPNFPEMYFSLWGAETSGIANPINPLLDSSIIKEIMISANSSVLIALGPVPGSDIWQKILEIKDQIPSLKAVISLFGDDIPATSDNRVPVYGFEKLMAQQEKYQLLAKPPQQQDICSFFHTGGTTGLPKLAKHTHLNELTNAAQLNLISSVSSDDTLLVGLPIFHVNAAIASGLGSVMKGSCVLLAGPGGYRSKNVVKNLLTILDNFNVAFMMAVPTVYAGLLESINSQKIKVKKPAHMKLAMCGAAPLSPDLRKKFTQITGIDLVEGYGSTEGTAVSTVMPLNSLAKQAAVGLPIPGMTLIIAQIDANGQLEKICPPGEPGEILIAGNNVFPGYVEESHNKNLWVNLPSGEKLLRTGDLGKLDELGYLSLCGRQKELIIRGGHNIDPKMIEDVATTLDGVSIAAAVPRPDAYAGELPVLYVTLTADSELNSMDIMEYMQKHVPERAAIPKSIFIIKEMPLTAVGKIFKPMLVCVEIENIIAHNLKQEMSEDQYQISVQPDKKQGVLASITVTVSQDQQNAMEEKIKAMFVAYTFNYQILFGEKSLEEV